MTQLSGTQALAQVHQHLRRGDTVSALRLTAEIVRQAPQFAEGQFVHAQVLIRAKRTASARAILAKLDEIAPEAQKAPLDIELARSFLVDERWADAVEPAQRARESGSENELIAAEGAALAIEALAGSGRGEEATGVLEDAKSKGIDTLGLAKAVGVAALQGVGDAGAAISGLSEHVGKVGAAALDLLPALRTLAELHARGGNDDEAFTVFKRAAKIASPGADPRPHAQGVAKLIEEWSKVSKLPSLTGDDASGDGGERYVAVIGLPGGSTGSVAAVAKAAGAVTSSYAHVFLGTAMTVFPSQAAGFAGWLPPMTKATRPQLLKVRESVARLGVSEHPDAPAVIDAQWAQVYGILALPLMLPDAKVVLVDRDIADAAVGSMMSEGAPQAPFAQDAPMAGVALRDVQRLLEHVAGVFGAEGATNPFLRVSHDALVSDDDAARCELLSFLGLASGEAELNTSRDAAKSFAGRTHAQAGLAARFEGRIKDLRRALEA
ncbi:MAG: sulfotransferase [Planctomycetota bacterium]